MALGAFAALWLKHQEYLSDATDTWLAFAAISAVGYLVALLVENATRFAASAVRLGVASYNVREAARVNDQTAAANLSELSTSEENALRWIYHRKNGRVRANIHSYDIERLERFGILKFEDAKAHGPEHIFIINPAIAALVAAKYGPRKENWGEDYGPWVERRI